MLLRKPRLVNWREKMARDRGRRGDYPKLDTARPGHADLFRGPEIRARRTSGTARAGSAREPAARVMAGSLQRRSSAISGSTSSANVLSIADIGVRAGIEGDRIAAARAEGSPLRMADPGVEAEVKRWIDGLKEPATTGRGGREVIPRSPSGLGS